MMNLRKITEEVINTARCAGDFISAERKSFSPDRVESKGKANFVSYVDIQAEQLIISQLQKIVPEAGFITEEGSAGHDREELLWVIDPLDGTTNFIHDMPPYAVSIALMQGNEVVSGVVYEITHEEMFYAWKGGNAWMNRKQIAVSKAATSRDALIATGFPYHNFEQASSFLQCVEYLMRESHGIRRLGSAATDLAYVAAGRFDAFWERGLQPWDVAAGSLLVKEAGGRCSDFRGENDFIFKGEITSANAIYFNEFQSIIEKYYYQIQGI